MPPCASLVLSTLPVHYPSFSDAGISGYASANSLFVSSGVGRRKDILLKVGVEESVGPNQEYQGRLPLRAEIPNGVRSH